MNFTNRCKYLSDFDLKAAKAAFSASGTRSARAAQLIALIACRDISL